MEQRITPAEVLALAEIIEGIHRGARIYVEVSPDRVLEGVMRHLNPEKGSGNHASFNENIWDQWVRVSATFEHWFPVPSLVAGLAEGTVAIDTSA